MSVVDDWELAYDSENDTNVTAERKESKESKEKEKEKEEKRLLEKKQMEESEEVLIEDLFMEQLISSKRKAIEQNQQTKQKPHQTFHSTFVVKNNNFFLKKEENDRKIKAQVAKKREHIEFLKKQNEVFGDAPIDELQEQYCDFEDKYT